MGFRVGGTPKTTHTASCLRFLSIFFGHGKSFVCGTACNIWIPFHLHIPTDTRFPFVLVIPPSNNLLSSVDHGFFETLSQRLRARVDPKDTAPLSLLQRGGRACVKA